MAQRKAVMTPAKKSALQWIQANEPWLSQVHKDIWNFHEPAWREYRSAAYYVDLLRQQGFEVEEGPSSHPMPNTTLFPATARIRSPSRSRATACTNTRPAIPTPIPR
jgi:metal-dependent amidase/aminoacylase/carboxypeptidase family protein